MQVAGTANLICPSIKLTNEAMSSSRYRVLQLGHSKEVCKESWDTFQMWGKSKMSNIKTSRIQIFAHEIETILDSIHELIGRVSTLKKLVAILHA